MPLAWQAPSREADRSRRVGWAALAGAAAARPAPVGGRGGVGLLVTDLGGERLLVTDGGGLGLAVWGTSNPPTTPDVQRGLRSRRTFLRTGKVISCTQAPTQQRTNHCFWRVGWAALAGAAAARLAPGVRDYGSGCRVQGAGFMSQGSGCRVQGSGFRVQGSGFRVWGWAALAGAAAAQPAPAIIKGN